MRTVGEFIQHVCDDFPEHILFVDLKRQEQVTYARWGENARELSAELIRQGFRPGDFIAWRFGNDYGYLAAYGGAVLAEGVVAPLSQRLTAREAARILSLVKPRWFLTDVRGAQELAPVLETSTVEFLGIYDQGIWHWQRFEPSGSARLPNTAIAHLRFTSGTSGEPKAVMLTHDNMLCRVGNTGHYAQPGDVFYLAIPFVFRPDRLIQALSVGGTVVVQETSYPGEILRCWQETGVTFAWLVPSLIGLLIQLKPEQIPAGLRLRGVNTGGAYLYRQWEERFEELFGITVYQQYGMSEGCVAFENPREKRVGSVGKCSPGVKAKICDERGRELPLGQTGELWYRGQNVMLGYLDRPELTAAVLCDGWLRTGDLARFDQDGYLYIEGRLKDLIHSGGLKYSPREVEDVLLRYPGIIEAAVVAVPQPLKGEVGKAYYVADKPIRSSELREFCRNYLADYKIPREWEQVESLPKLASGKVAKRLVGER